MNRNLITAACLAIASFGASAATYNPPAIVDIDTGGYVFGVSPVLVAKGLFTDTFNFSWAGLASAAASSALIEVVSSKRDILDSSFTATLYEGLNGTGSVLSSGLSVSDVMVAGSDFSLIVSGNAVGKSGGQYTVTANVSAVPEPGTYALMVAGLAAIGLGVRRRQARG